MACHTLFVGRSNDIYIRLNDLYVTHVSTGGLGTDDWNSIVLCLSKTSIGPSLIRVVIRRWQFCLCRQTCRHVMVY